MIVVCANCDTKYHLAEKLIGQKGQKVRCTYCDYTWMQPPLIPLTSSTEPSLIINKAPQHFTLFKSFLIFLLIFFLGLSIVSYVLLFQDHVSDLFAPVSKALSFYKFYKNYILTFNL